MVQASPRSRQGGRDEHSRSDRVEMRRSKMQEIEQRDAGTYGRGKQHAGVNDSLQVVSQEVI